MWIVDQNGNFVNTTHVSTIRFKQDEMNMVDGHAIVADGVGTLFTGTRQECKKIMDMLYDTFAENEQLFDLQVVSVLAAPTPQEQSA